MYKQFRNLDIFKVSKKLYEVSFNYIIEHKIITEQVLYS
jgi:hypothetical protein